jgi:membrane protein required for colicin V production
MIDFVLGLALAAMLVRGWMRGFVRESLDLVGLVLGVLIAFRLSGPFGAFLTDSFGVSPEAGRIVGGIVLFVLFGVLLSIGAHFLSKMMNLPGLSMVNRVGGAAVAMGWGALIVLIAVSLLAVLPVPESWRDEIEESRVVSLIAGEDALPRQLFEGLAGDNVMAAVSSIRNLFGTARAVPSGDEIFEIPPAPADEVRQDRTGAAEVLARLNEERVGAGVGAVSQVGAITQLAEDHAMGQYETGRVHRLAGCIADLALRSYTVVRCDNGVALAATARGGLEGILDTEEGRAMAVNPNFDRGGVGVVDGPTGRIVVVILAG